MVITNEVLYRKKFNIILIYIILQFSILKAEYLSINRKKTVCQDKKSKKQLTLAYSYKCIKYMQKIIIIIISLVFSLGKTYTAVLIEVIEHMICSLGQVF